MALLLSVILSSSRKSQRSLRRTAVIRQNPKYLRTTLVFPFAAFGLTPQVSDSRALVWVTIVLGGEVLLGGLHRLEWKK
jgi:hypothetical protein